MITPDNPEDRSIIHHVTQAGQEHVFRYWDELSGASRRRLLNQLKDIDFDLMRKLWKAHSSSSEGAAVEGILEPVEVIPVPRTTEQQNAAEEARRIGQQALRDGRVAAFVVAGGQGTRLGFDGPKGCFPVGPVTGKSLFEMHAEKIRAASLEYGVPIPWYIMTSETNDEATREFFAHRNFFGIDESDVFLLKQKMIPALDEQGRLILDEKDHVFMNPNGHGGSLMALEESGALDDMTRRGITVVSYFQVDNVLIKIIDPVFLGYHIQAQAEMCSKVVQKRDPGEKVGVFGKVNGKMKVIEYSDMREEDKKAKNPDGSLKYGAGNVAIHLIDVAFVDREVRGGFKLPYHTAHKKIPFVDENGTRIHPDVPNGFKFETFVFDALNDTTRTMVMEVVREEEFSPVKNRTGEDSESTAKRDLSNYFGRWLEAAGVAVPRLETGDVDGTVEISPLFAADRETFLRKASCDIAFEKAFYLGPE